MTGRTLHPGAWWLWALGLAVVAAGTTNPVPLLLILAVATLVVVECRSSAPWALSYRAYAVVAGIVFCMRVAFRVLFGTSGAGTILLSLPGWQLPAWLGGVQLLGPLTGESLLAAACDGLRLATMIVCVGAANALANPKRLLAALPGALHEVGTAVVVAVSVFPQLAQSARRVQRARQLRGATGDLGHSRQPVGVRPRVRRAGVLRALVVPVLTDALERSLHLAAAMDTRGYGRRAAVAASRRRALTAVVLISLFAVCAGVYGSLDAAAPRWMGVPLLICGAALLVVALYLTGRAVQRTRYRPDKWDWRALAVAGSGVVAGALAVIAAAVVPASLVAPQGDPWWPAVPWLVLVGVLIAGAPAVLVAQPHPATSGVDIAPLQRQVQ